MGSRSPTQLDPPSTPRSRFDTVGRSTRGLSIVMKVDLGEEEEDDDEDDDDN